MGNLESDRHTLWEVTRELVACGLVAGSNGNASLRLSGDQYEGNILITPAQRPYRQLAPLDLVVIDLEGEPVEGEFLPSSEAALHLTLYKARQDVGAIIHTHSPFASVTAVAGLEIPPIVDEMVMKIGGSVMVADYGFPSSEELAKAACETLGERNAALLRNHGLVGVGPTAWDALEVCQLVERIAQIFVYATMLGKANSLPPEIINIEQDLFRMARAVDPMADGLYKKHVGKGT